MRLSELEEAGLGDVLAEVVESAKELSRVEVALARREAERDVAALRHSVIIGGLAVFACAVSVSLLLAGLAMYLGSALFAVCTGAGIGLAGVLLGVWARRSMPTEFLERTRIRAAHTLRTVKEEL